ncbi:MAG: sporulation protein YlmC with PRC-barrel domain [Planctomycetota bacterium]|jgi:sporulation protein YlmC with PRC-barrel domain
MLYSTDAITGFLAAATDGELGKVLGFGFDDQDWTVPYVIVRAGWLPGRVVMVDSKSVKMVDGANKRILFDLTKDELRHEPDIHSEPPVHKLEESVQLGRHSGEDLMVKHKERVEATNLRNTSEVIGYTAEATDGKAGKVSDVVVDTKAWTVHALVVRQGWLFRTHRTASPKWVRAIDWATKEVKICVDWATIRSSPVFNLKAPVNKTHETRVVDYTAESHLQQREDVSG